MYKELWSAPEDTAKTPKDKVPDLIRIHTLKVRVRLGTDIK